VENDKLSVMVVDDQTDLLATTTKMLTHNGYIVHAFDNPIEALAHIKGDGCTNCNILISDLRMPQMSGFELVRQIKEMRPDMGVIVMTAFKINKEEAQLVLPTSKIDAFLKKPFSMAELIQAVKQCTKEDWHLRH